MCTKPKLYKIFQSSGDKKLARFRQLMAAINFFFPKKHIPMLFHKHGDSASETDAILYFDKATSYSL